MMVCFAGLRRYLPEMRDYMDFIDDQPVTVVMEYPFDDPRAIDLQVPGEKVREAYSPDGPLERLYGKAFVVFTYHLWDESSRKAIAGALGVKSDDVKADLMGEWRHLRNWLVHQSPKSEIDYFDNAEILAEVLDLKRGCPEVDARVAFELLARLNVIQVRVSQSTA